MLNITFNKTKPSQKQYEYSIVGNAQVDVVRFVLQNDICSDYNLSELANFSAYVKVQSAGGEYIDKISSTSSYDSEKETLTIDFTLLKKTTQFKNISLQLQFESEEGQVVAQTEIVCLSLKSSIKADEEIPDLFPSVLTQMEHELADHEERIDELEKGGTGGGKVDDVKVNGESVVEDKVANIDLTPYATKEELNGKQDVLTFDNEPTENSSNPVKSGGVFLSIQEVIAISQGKCQSFTITLEDNPQFDTEDASISGITNFVDEEGNTIQVSSLHNGDIVLITDTDIPDRWYSKASGKFHRMETAKVDLSSYYTKTETDNKLADKQNTIDSSHKLASDLVDDTNQNNKFVSANEKQTWNAKANESVIGDQYDSTKTYAVGDIVIYNNALYKCSTAITQAEAWDSSHWTATTVAELVADETIAINDIKNTMSFKKISYSDYRELSSNEKQALLDVGCQIIGTVSVNVGGGNVINPVLFPRRNYTTYSQGIFIAGSSNSSSTVGTWEQNHSADNLTIKVLFRGVDEKLTVQRLSNLNGASFPQYPSDASTKTYIPKLVNGSWVFVEEI